ncbi:MAG TPA: DUF2272 domain-containing protein [Candidatus Binatia bacterium]|nr:DUF2272 domain-containing protein [Candidatus Binatia bacterium]
MGTQESLRDSLSVALEELLDERDAALAANETAKAATAQTEIDRIKVVLATVQFAINQGQALNLNAVAARLQESIEAQRAIGLKTALKTLKKAVDELREETDDDVADTGGGPGQGASIQAKPGPNQSVVNMLIAEAIKRRLDPMMVLTIVAIESDFKPRLTNPRSSAAGLFQFIDSTWIKEGGAKFPGRGGKGNGHAAGASIETQIEIGCKFVAKLVKFVKEKLGSASTLHVYMAHQQGQTGALKILKADSNEAIESVIGDDAASDNGFGGMTVAQTIAKFRNTIRVNEDQALSEVVAAPLDSATGAGGVTNGSFAQKAIEVALAEMEMFGRRNGVVVRESQQPLNARVRDYFRFVDSGNSDPTTVPWSAAYMSFVMHKAGATNEQFPKSIGHATYILASLTNRLANRFNASIVYFDRHEKAPRLGDLVGFSNDSRVRTRADIEALLSKPKDEQFFSSHTDLVVDVDDGEILVVGGNVSQSITTKRIRTDNEGRIVPSEKHFFLLRVSI